MAEAVPVAFHWSGGKDSAHALGKLLADDSYDVRCLVTTIHASRGESTVHGLPTALLRAQAQVIGLPLRTIALGSAGLDDYVEVVNAASARMRAEGIRAVAFGDQAQSGVLSYKVEQFGPLGLDVVEPLWELSPQACFDDFVAAGIAAITVVADAHVLGPEHLGVPVDETLVAALPAGADPGGENGEYHSFVWDAPYFDEPVRVQRGEIEHIRREIGTTDGRQEFRYWRLHVRADPA